MNESMKELIRNSIEAKELISERLKSISDLDDRRMLRSVLNDVYSGVIDYSTEMYTRLEGRIYDEVVNPLDDFYIYTSIEERGKVDPIDDFLHPVLLSDLEDIDMGEISQKIVEGESVVLASVFMQCSFTMLSKLFERKRSYKGYVNTGKDIHEISVRVVRCNKYVDEIKKLYRVFQKNNKPWGTINFPFAYKFVDIVIDTPLPIKPNETIKEITFDLAEYEKYKIPNVIPLWNIVRINAKDAEFPDVSDSIEAFLESVKTPNAPEPMPIVDTIIYDHKVALENFGIQNGYLVALENADFIYTRREPERLIIESTDNKKADWELLKVESVANVGKRTFSYELLTNRREQGFSGKFSTVKSLVIRTRGEISRVLASYGEMSRQLEFQEVEILESYNKPIETFDFNGFIDDNIRNDSHKKIMLVTFSAANREDYLLQDKMSFMVSEIQFLFPEYKCIGELV